MKKEVAIKLNIQLASSLNLIWKSVFNLEVSCCVIAFLVSFVDLYGNFPCYFTVLKNIANFTFGKIKSYKVIKFYNCHLRIYMFDFKWLSFFYEMNRGVS